ncbi:MAG TPA: ABC transporter permease subunit [Melioribacteraceae bacterium]|nr:ABC transporter permease subunit [Melioribacteraceae bacterium]
MFSFINLLIPNRKLKLADIIILATIMVLLYFGVSLIMGDHTLHSENGLKINLDNSELPIYAFFSALRMLAAYFLSVIFSLVYGKYAAKNKKAEKIMLPLLDILQSVPILSFLPVVVLSLRVVFPQGVAAEIGSVVLIFTSQAWNMTFSWYQSLTTIPKDLKEASKIFRLNSWSRFKILEFPFGIISFIWNSMMSWAGGWFFLMAAEIFTVGDKDFRLPGLGSYLQEAANQNNFEAIFIGLTTLVIIIIVLDQLVWRPLLAWSDKFKLEMTESDNPPTSWFYDALQEAKLTNFFTDKIFKPIWNFIDKIFAKSSTEEVLLQKDKGIGKIFTKLIKFVFYITLLYGLYKILMMLGSLTFTEISKIGLGVLATLLRVSIALTIAFLWTVVVGVAIATNKKFATFMQPIIQILASIPATALFPVILLFIIKLPNGINIAAVILMLLGTQWYLLFNIIAGASSIPQELKYTSKLLQFNTYRRWKVLILPAIFPYIITGAIAASGGAWNASIVSEYVNFSGKTLQTIGIGSLIADSTAKGNYPLLLASTLAMIIAVVTINRLVWRKLYAIAEEKYKMD